ncbi:MAG: Na+/H+ antiporter NhaA [Gammaproteobacteria bacterium]|nr:Na+/H+ antiporter NhaA [Gammaproteobacteria bacterium]NND36426.1 Na+/H+ antiporter NhaA [Gammaproteobacteria bacterium]
MPKNSFNAFFKLESAGGILLIIAAAAAMLLKNSPVGSYYTAFLDVPIQIRIGPLDLNKPLFLWVNDGLMAVFFFTIGMEVKREILVGELSDPKQIVLPGMAGIGGIVGPALIYYALNIGDDLALQGWAIPTATDIAFALAVLAMVGNVPTALKLFLMTLAIIDDLGAIIIIAVFYTSNLSMVSLFIALMATTGLIWLSLKRTLRIAPFIIIGLILWVSVLKSGVHATIAGVLLGFFIPMGDHEQENGSPLENLLHGLHPWVAFAILPVFAFVNGGVDLTGMTPASLLEPVPLGIILGLLVGKQLGVFSFAWLSIKTGIAALPQNVSWGQLYGTSILTGIGFTMSLFISSLAFEEVGMGYNRSDRLAIIVSSLVCGAIGYAVLKLFSVAKERRAMADSTGGA